MAQEHSDEFLYDVRLQERHIAKGLITREALNKHNESRRDVASQSEILNLDHIATSAKNKRPKAG